jgi:Predicted glycosyltransferases
MNDQLARLAIVTVTYNSSTRMSAFLEGVGPRPSGVRLLIVDSGSSDLSALRAKLSAAGVELEALARNVGYGSGSNVGARLVAAEWYAFVNPDVVVSAESLLRLAARADEAGLACVGPEVESPDGVRARVPTRRLSRAWLSGVPRGELPDGIEYVRFVSGCCLLVRGDAFISVGGFDEQFFMFSEEVDLQRRLWLSGNAVGRDSSERAITDGGQSSDGVSGRWAKTERDVAYVQFARKHYPWPAVVAAVVYRWLRIIFLPGYQPRSQSLQHYSDGLRRVFIARDRSAKVTSVRS